MGNASEWLIRSMHTRLKQYAHVEERDDPQERENLFPGGLLQEYSACLRRRPLRMPSPRV